MKRKLTIAIGLMSAVSSMGLTSAVLADVKADAQAQLEAGEARVQAAVEQAKAERAKAERSKADRGQTGADHARIEVVKVGAGEKAALRESGVVMIAGADRAIPEEKLVKAPFLGVAATEAPAALTDQLALPSGVGLIVDFVEANSPAHSAGLQSNDLLQKLNDQLLINVDQFRTLIRTYKVGEEISITLLRKGQPVVCRATLVERELPALSAASRAGGVVAFREGDGGELAALRNQLKEITVATPRVIHLDRDGNSSSTITHDDGISAVTIRTVDGKTTVKATESKTGKLIFEGPFNTQDEMQKLPADLRKRVESLRVDQVMPPSGIPDPVPAPTPPGVPQSRLSVPDHSA